MTIINSVIKGKQPVIDTLNVTPTTSAQQITAPQGTDGYSPVNVSAVTSSIDANIVAGNIKKDVQILGVTGSYEGTTPTGTVNITSNGTHNVSSYEYAEVLVPTTAPAYYIEKTKDANGKAGNGSHLMDFSTFTDVGERVFAEAYAMNTNVTGSVDLSGLTNISGYYGCFSMFLGCTGITSVDLSGLTTISQQNVCTSMFQNCTGITSVDLSGLTSIPAGGQYAFQSMFRYCSGLTNIDISALETIYGNYACTGMFNTCTSLTSITMSSLRAISGSYCCQEMFRNCTALTSADLSNLVLVSGQSACSGIFWNTGLVNFVFPSLKTVNDSTSCGQFFRSCTNITEVKFPAIKSVGSNNIFWNMFQACSNVTVHFPTNMQSVMGSWSDVTNGFGGTNTTVLFDLPATNILTGADTKEYERNPKYDTATALAWRINGTMPNTTTYYTSGLTDPTVGTTIYSDSACTIAETTVDSIA